MDKELLQFLLDRDYAVVIDSKPVLTKKFKDLFPETITTVPALTTIVYKEKEEPLDVKKKIWNEFIERISLPHRVVTSTGTYTIRQFSLPAVNKLIKIIKDPEVNYTTLVESTKNYYNTVTYKILLSKYLLNEVWKDEYTQFEKNKGKPLAINDGSSRFEE